MFYSIPFVLTPIRVRTFSFPPVLFHFYFTREGHSHKFNFLVKWRPLRDTSAPR